MKPTVLFRRSLKNLSRRTKRIGPLLMSWGSMCHWPLQDLQLAQHTNWSSSVARTPQATSLQYFWDLWKLYVEELTLLVFGPLGLPKEPKGTWRGASQGCITRCNCLRSAHGKQQSWLWMSYMAICINCEEIHFCTLGPPHANHVKCRNTVGCVRWNDIQYPLFKYYVQSDNAISQSRNATNRSPSSSNSFRASPTALCDLRPPFKNLWLAGGKAVVAQTCWL